MYVTQKTPDWALNGITVITAVTLMAATAAALPDANRLQIPTINHNWFPC